MIVKAVQSGRRTRLTVVPPCASVDVQEWADDLPQPIRPARQHRPRSEDEDEGGDERSGKEEVEEGGLDFLALPIDRFESDYLSLYRQPPFQPRRAKVGGAARHR